MVSTAATKYNIVDCTPFKRDPLKELAGECHREGLKLFFYYSQLDWRHPDYLPRGRTGLKTREIGSLPLETSLTMNDSWGFNITDGRFKALRELIGYLVRAAGNDANLLLNVGPRPDGTIQPEAAEGLRDMGRWLATYGK